MKQAYRILAVLLVALLALAGCMPVQENTPATSPADSASGDAAPAGEPADGSSTASDGDIVLRMSWWGNDTRHQSHLDAIEVYEQRNSGVKIEAEYGGMEGYRQKLATQLAGGQEPDLTWVDPPWLHDFSSQGDFFVDIYAHEDIVDLTGFDRGFLDENLVFNGKLIGLPTGYNAHIFILDDRIAELGIDLDRDWDWDYLIEAGKIVHENDPNQYLLNTESKFTNVITFRDYMNQLLGTTLISDDYEMNFTEEQLIQGLTLVRDLYENNVIEPAQDADVYLQQSTTNPKWLSGDMRGALCWSSTATSNQGFADNIKAMKFPQLPGATNTGIIYRPMPPVCVSNRSASVEEALKFLDFYINDDECIEIMVPTRPFAPTTKGQEKVVEENAVIPAYLEAFNISVANAGPADNVPSTNSEVEDAFLDMVQAVGYGTATPEQAAAEGMVVLEEILGRIKP